MWSINTSLLKRYVEQNQLINSNSILYLSMRLSLICFLVFFQINTAFGQAQNNSTLTKKRFTLNPWENVNGFRFAAAYNRHLETEGSYVLSSWPKVDPGLAGLAMRIQYIGLGLEYLRVGRQNVIGAKLSYENTFSILAMQLGSDFLVSNKDKQYRLLPKVGLTLFGTWTVYYGYNIDLYPNSSIITMPHVISLQCTIEKNQSVAVWR